MLVGKGVLMNLVSVIIPVYNVEQYLRKCLESVIEQSYPELEIILIDDGSTDSSGNICDEYAKKDCRITVYHQSNKGVSATRNVGIQKAKGEWIVFVDSDDWIETNLVETCISYMEDEENIDICFFGIQESDGEDAKSIQSGMNIVNINKVDFQDLQFRIFNRDRCACCDKKLIKLSSPCKFYRKSMLQNNEIFFDENLINGEDGLFNLYAYYYARKGVCIEYPFYHYRIRKGSVTRRYTQGIEQDFLKLHECYKKFIENIGGEKIFHEVFLERIIWSFSFCCILKYCHPDNPLKYAERYKQFKKGYQYFDYYKIQTVSLKKFGIKKKILFFFIKKSWFALIDLLCKLEYKKKR